MADNQSEHSIPSIDIAIVGGGVAGTYAAYRLAESNYGNNNLNIKLFEANREERIGGRLWSYNLKSLPNYPVEIGGVSFHDYQQNVFGLCSKLNLELIDNTFYNGDSHIQYLRGRQFKYEDYENSPDQVPYFLQESEESIRPQSIMLSALEKGIPGFTQRLTRLVQSTSKQELNGILGNLTQFLRSVEIGSGKNKKTIFKYGFWNFLVENLSYEAYQMLHQSLSSRSFFLSINLYDTLINISKQAIGGGRYKSIKKGYQELPKTLAKNFEKLGGEICYSMSLQSLKLDIDEQSNQKTTILEFKDENQILRKVRAHYVILAIPQIAIKGLSPDSCIFTLSPSFMNDVNTVSPVPASKLYMTYKYPWWQDDFFRNKSLFLDSGSSQTDLPIRECAYLSSDDGATSLLQASGNDSLFTYFWDAFSQSSRFGLRNPRVRVPFSPPWPCQENVIPELQVPTDMVFEAQRQLKELHYNYDIPEPLDAIFCDWSDRPFGGGWHAWNPHLKSFEVIPRIRKPVEDCNIYICGEAFSSHQGWVEGALNSAEMVLEQYFGLPRPDWVEPTYDFGP